MTRCIDGDASMLGATAELPAPAHLLCALARVNSFNSCRKGASTGRTARCTEQRDHVMALAIGFARLLLECAMPTQRYIALQMLQDRALWELRETSTTRLRASCAGRGDARAAGAPDAIRCRPRRRERGPSDGRTPRR
ncbi:hypothetical protein PHYSODRAFT_329980 [Phytophthora sojae]|uniref:Uncharacterized protein n=1 Tax=Phytophthora sojae (strain P6497) TaxID=1094619 RepID=G4ZC94_PHYSP|nr:hypothetical protein PHYSODRAFT_329980 [Phytophthora sojae]EGZ22122.1 hypothetical protein PHYSODRAFT_329980 [Phytophthora sojae]|eukprot:XP_009524839.1 hypothetical protein PHYSODRAFT_329980 [Phytophthora sojae]